MDTGIYKKYIIMKLLGSFGFTFLFIFLALNANEIILLIGSLSNLSGTLSQIIALFLYRVPYVIVMSTPLAVCIGFTNGLINLNISEKLSQNKRNIIPVICSGIIIAIFTYIIIDFIMPITVRNLRYLLSTISINNIRTVTTSEINSIQLLQIIRDANDGEKPRYILELSIKFILPLGVLFSTLFAYSISIIFYQRKKTALCICILSSVLYCLIFVYGGNISLIIMWIPNIIFLFISVLLIYINF